MAATTTDDSGGAQQAPVAELVKQLSEQTSRLARQEAELARLELVQKGKRAGIGAGMFGAAGVFGLYALGALVAAGILALSLAVKPWLAALIVAVVLAAVAGVAALAGRKNVAEVGSLVPEQATESVKEDVQWTANRARAARK